MPSYSATQLLLQSFQKLPLCVAEHPAADVHQAAALGPRRGALVAQAPRLREPGVRSEGHVALRRHVAHETRHQRARRHGSLDRRRGGRGGGGGGSGSGSGGRILHAHAQRTLQVEVLLLLLRRRGTGGLRLAPVVAPAPAATATAPRTAAATAPVPVLVRVAVGLTVAEDSHDGGRGLGRGADLEERVGGVVGSVGLAGLAQVEVVAHGALVPHTRHRVGAAAVADDARVHHGAVLGVVVLVVVASRVLGGTSTNTDAGTRRGGHSGAKAAPRLAGDPRRDLRQQLGHAEHVPERAAVLVAS